MEQRKKKCRCDDYEIKLRILSRQRRRSLLAAVHFHEMKNFTIHSRASSHGSMSCAIIRREKKRLLFFSSSLSLLPGRCSWNGTSKVDSLNSMRAKQRRRCDDSESSETSFLIHIQEREKELEDDDDLLRAQPVSFFLLTKS